MGHRNVSITKCLILAAAGAAASVAQIQGGLSLALNPCGPSPQSTRLRVDIPAMFGKPARTLCASLGGMVLDQSVNPPMLRVTAAATSPAPIMKTEEFSAEDLAGLPRVIEGFARITLQRPPVGGSSIIIFYRASTLGRDVVWPVVATPYVDVALPEEPDPGAHLAITYWWLPAA